MSEALTDLREAAHRLTHPQTRLMWQGDGHDHEWVPVTDRRTRERTGEYKCAWCDNVTTAPDHAPAGTKVVKQIDEPLLDQLAAAVVSDLGSFGNGRSRNPSLPFDMGAFEMMRQIDERVRAWLEDLGARPGRKVSLRELVSSWLVLYSAGHHGDAEVDNYRAVLERWETAIRDKLSPSKPRELLFPCPICNQEYVNIGPKLPNGEDDPNDIERVRALNELFGDTLDEYRAVCRHCDRVWRGIAGARELSGLVQEKAKEQTA